MMANCSLLDLLHEEAESSNIFMHDWWAALLASAFGKVVCIGRATITCRQHSNNSMGAVNFFHIIMKQIVSKREIEKSAAVRVGVSSFVR